MIVRRWTKQANKLVTKRPYQTRVTRSSDCYLERNTNFSIISNSILGVNVRVP